MRSHLPRLGARSAAATVQLQSRSPGGWLVSIAKQKDKKQMRLSCAGTETGTELLGPLDSAPCCCSMRSYSGLQNFYLHCCSKKGHPGVTEDGGESFLWAAILRDCRDFQVITKYPSTLHLPWTLQTCVSPDSKISWLYNSRELPLSS